MKVMQRVLIFFSVFYVFEKKGALLLWQFLANGVIIIPFIGFQKLITAAHNVETHLPPHMQDTA